MLWFSARLARGEQIELLVEKTSKLEEQAVDFKHVSNDLKKHMWWKNVKLWIIIISVLLVCTFRL
jgi:vesicle-associated membrane protein 7